MKKLLQILAVIACACILSPAQAEPDAQEIVRKVLDSDPWGLGGAEVAARVVLTDKSNSTTELTFRARSRRHDPPLSKSILRFSSPPELLGAAFLQIQNKSGDDERYLYLPDLKRARRISASSRNMSFLGTDFSFADLDRRDLRDGEATVTGEETVGKFACHKLQVVPKRADSQYSKLELWVRKDNFLPLRMLMYDRPGRLLKTFTTQEVRRVDNIWFISRSRMVNHVETHTTDLILDTITVKNDFSDEEFTVRSLEK